MKTVVFNTPIYTGLFLDTHEAISDRFTGLRAVMESSDRPAGNWCMPDAKVRESGLQIDVDNRRGMTILPEFIAERDVSGAELAQSLEALGISDHIAVDGTGFALRLGEFQIRQTDFGYATALFVCDIVVDEDGAGGRPEPEDIEAISSKVTTWLPLVRETIDFLRQAIPPKFLLAEATDRKRSRPRRYQRRADDAPVEMLWVHRVFVIEHLKDTDPETLANRIIYRHSLEKKTNLSIVQHASLYVGVGNSVVMHQGASDTALLRQFANIIAMQNAYFARIENFDADLFHLINRLGDEFDRKNISTARKISKLETRSEEIVDLLEYAELFRSAYLDYAYHLDPQSRIVWEDISRIWGTRERFHAVDMKLTSLEKVYDRVRNSLRSLYDGQLNTFVIIFTLFGLLSVMVDVIDFLQESGFQSVDQLRLGILIFMFVLLAVFGFTVLNRKTPM